ncbi:PLDc N-terminal domain-containing protein [Brucepastera parasyntrophica]|uniref:PLDc N-terminal domain-containing protein n=1 Tax=Brucepastera parasyntrophica TaxID=2880008 RepID=UPI00210E905E|nr:PLDc N-terminal domain-containing protein [Brucepastera parasyntrophica]ULQ59143.1 PLDc N-terminal domain-containing protein [Brucepastera parasyntrophica]
MNIAGILLIAGYFLNFVFIIFILFFEQGDSARRFSWLMAIAFIPIAGIFLYILFSGNFFTRNKRMVDAINQVNGYYSTILPTQKEEIFAAFKTDDGKYFKDWASLIRLNLLYGKSPLKEDNTVFFFKSGEEKYQALFAELEKAQKTIFLSYFIIKKDVTGKRLIEILTKKAEEGVKIRLLYDHVGSLFTSRTLFTPLKRREEWSILFIRFLSSILFQSITETTAK